jgi:hypothetical protein
MTTEIGEVVVYENGDATGHGLSYRFFTEILAPIDIDNARAVAANVGPFCVGLATALSDLYDEIDAATVRALAEFHACTLELVPGGTPIFSGATNSSQGIAWVRVDGVANLFLGIRTAGSPYMSDERIRIVRFVYAEDGSTITHTEYSAELQIGHGQALSAIADGANITLYCSVYTGDSGGVSVQKGFTRITWNGSSTSQSDVDAITVLPDDDAGLPLSRYYSVTPCVSTDGKKLILSANNNVTVDSSKYLLVYDIEAVLAEFEASGDPTTIPPIAIIPRPAISTEGQNSQGMAATAHHIYHLTGYYQPLGEKTVIVQDYAGNIVRVVPLALSLNNYSMDELYDHESYGFPFQFEPEDLTLTDTGEILVCCCESWLTSTPTVLFEGKQYAAIRDASGIEESPLEERFWVPTKKAVSHGIWSASSSYTAGGTKSRIVKEVWGLRQASYVGASGEYRLNAYTYCPRSTAPLQSGKSDTDLSYPYGQAFQVKSWSPNNQEYHRSFEISRRAMQVHDTRPGSAGQYFFLGVENIEGREYSYLRAYGGDLDFGSGINLYGSDDPLHPDGIRLFQGGGDTVWVSLESGTFIGGSVTLGASSNPWSELHVDTCYWYGNCTPEIGSTGETNREYMYIRADGVLANGAGLNLYGSGDSTNPDVARIYEGGGSRYVEINSGVFRQDGSTKLGESVRKWPEAWVDMLMLTWTSVANMPSASSYPGGVMLCSNGDSGSPCLAVAYGTYWYRVPLGTVISAT